MIICSERKSGQRLHFEMRLKALLSQFLFKFRIWVISNPNDLKKLTLPGFTGKIWRAGGRKSNHNYSSKIILIFVNIYDK